MDNDIDEVEDVDIQYGVIIDLFYPNVPKIGNTNKEKLAYILSQGASANIENDGITPLEYMFANEEIFWDSDSYRLFLIHHGHYNLDEVVRVDNGIAFDVLLEYGLEPHAIRDSLKYAIERGKDSVEYVIKMYLTKVAIELHRIFPEMVASEIVT
jgi:hypothetical protein